MTKDLKLEVGKKYVDGRGEIIKILEVNRISKHYPIIGMNMKDGDTEYYCKNGRYDIDGERSRDLISEHREPVEREVELYFVYDPTIPAKLYKDMTNMAEMHGVDIDTGLTTNGFKYFEKKYAESRLDKKYSAIGKMTKVTVELDQ